MIEQSNTGIVVQQRVEASAATLFALLTDPRRHVEIDGSGMLQAEIDARPITGVGQIFTMAMRYPALGDYRTENHILEFEPDRRILWTTARAGQVPAGVQWGWTLEALGPQQTNVVHSHDWSNVTDPGVLARVSFPRVSTTDLETSVRNLAAAAAAQI